MNISKSIAAAALIATIVAALGLLGPRPTPIAAQTASPTPTPALVGTLPRAGGVGLAVWQGGRPEDLPAPATVLGCRLQALWLIRSGEFIGFVYGAPDFVNAPFRTAYPGPIPAGAIIVSCAAGGVPATATPAPTPVPTPVAGALPPVKESMLIIGFLFQRHLELPVGSSVTWANSGGSTRRVDAAGNPVINPITGL